MNIAQIEENVSKLLTNFQKAPSNTEDFIFDFLLSYGQPKASVTRLKSGNLNLSKNAGEVIWKKKVWFKILNGENLAKTLKLMAEHSKHNERFLIATDFQNIQAKDTRTEETLDVTIDELAKNFSFFLPWAGMEKAQHQDENPADVKAAEKMAKLYDAIRRDNPDKSPEFIHSLNVFLSRLLFCFFAEDTGIFTENQVTNAIDAHTQTDGSDLSQYLSRLFAVLNTPKKDRDADLPSHLSSFPYVNGRLFLETFTIPQFTRKSRQVIIECGDMDWSDINPDIFGSMFQAVIDADQRGSLGQHYTSVPNIMKVIEPLFLNELNEEFDRSRYEPRRLQLLLNRLSKIKIFDPACGSGNFLIIAYKEIKKLEIRIIKRLLRLKTVASKKANELDQYELIPKVQRSIAAMYEPELFSRIHLSQFYGIEIDDFAHEIAQLSLWLAEHQMNKEYFAEFGHSSPTLPLREAGQIAHGNACRLDWEEICPKESDDEIYILGNPPYLGFKMQDANQKADIGYVFNGIKGYKKLDYISCWFYKASSFISEINAKYAFVSTNSICQGEHASLLWPNLYNLNSEIFFAHNTFKWSNNAKAKAAVFCSIVGVGNTGIKNKYIYQFDQVKLVDTINCYLSPSKNDIIFKRSKPLSQFPKMYLGNMPKDDGNLILSKDEKNFLESNYSNANQFIRELLGAFEFLNGQQRWCLWIKENNLSEAISIQEIKQRIDRVREFRLKSTDKSANDMGQTPFKFREQHEASTNSIIIPTVSSERREYIPIGFLDKNVVIVAPNNAIYDPPVYLFGILTSRIHMTWMRTFSGKLKSDYRYSSALCYNTFPFPSISDQRKEEITQCVFRILEEREKHSEKTLAELYDPDKMPDGLREAHRLNDEAIERCYRSRPFESDEERLEYLFRLYEKMIQEEKDRDTLFAQQKKTRKKKSTPKDKEVKSE